MDTGCFDDLARALTGASSRRAALRLACGVVLSSCLTTISGDAKKKGKGKKKKKKLAPPPCPTACCADRDCGSRNRCLQGACVTGQGTCAAGANSCDAVDVPCNGKAGCKCWEAAAGETRCGMVPVGIQCGQCTTDAQCASFGSGAFCVTDSTPLGNCSCGTVGQGFCIVPCDRVCPPTGCCVNADCGAGQICSQGQCVTGAGTCQAGQDLCGATGGGGVSCNANANCDCFSAVNSGTRCGGVFAGDCGACAKDDDCAQHGPGAFCTGATGCCPGGGRRCVLPCPT